MVLDKLQTMVSYSSLRAILIDKGLARLGDPLVNFIYSLAKSCALGKFTSWKVPDKVLAQALRDAEMRSVVSQKASKHDLGVSVEALVVHEWIHQKVSIEDLVSILYEHLKTGDFSDKRKEERIAVQAFTALLLEIQKNY